MTDSRAFLGADFMLDRLEALRRALLALNTEKTPRGLRDGIAIFRYCAGLSLEQWDSFAGSHNLHEWLALPLEGDLRAFLDHIQNTLEHLAYLTDHDPLTGLANRRAFERTLDVEMERASRSSAPMSLALIDLDNFKSINDTHGHQCGDQILAAVADTIERTKRRYDFAARIGGEEFAVILSGAGLSEAQAIISRLHGAVANVRVQCAGTDAAATVGATCSIGLATYKGRSPVKATELFAAADRALYQAKGEGKDRVVTAPIMDMEPVPRTTLVHSNEKKFLFTGS